ncbi:hypothetical protein PI124_g16821 [Phytophthora idaei]|nr:hypothetical protein PI124_g16821 [Phytophthora idaei]
MSLTAQVAEHDQVWTVDSGSDRLVTSNLQWFEKPIPSAGKSITVGGNHQIPIKGTGDVKMPITDTKLKFNLLSVRQAVEDDFKTNFPSAKKCVLFFAHRTKFEAKTGEGARLYQFQASPAASPRVTQGATPGSGYSHTVTDMGLKDFDPKKD